MSVNTQALIRTAPSTSKIVEGQADDTGQNNPKEAADKFQSMLSSARGGEGDKQKGKAPLNADAETEQNSEETLTNRATATSNQPGDGAETQASSKASFPITNLADALRTVSQAVLGNGDDGKSEKTPTETADMAESGTNNPAQNRLVTALPLGTVLAAKLPNSPDAVQPQLKQGTSMPQTAHGFPVTPQQNAGADGEGAVKTGTSALFAQFGIEPERVGDNPNGTAGARSALPEEAAGTVKVLRQETHFAPNQRLSPAQQVGEQIATALKDLPGDVGRTQGGLTAKAEGPVRKTLDIQLTPHELGTVKVSLRMVGDNVEVTLATSKAQTAELLKQDRQLLDQMLRTTGFKADTITIQAADDRSNATSTNLSNNSSAQGQQGTNSGTFGNNPNQSDSWNGDGSRENRSDRNGKSDTTPGYEAAMEDGHETSTGNGLSDGIYM